MVFRKTAFLLILYRLLLLHMVIYSYREKERLVMAEVKTGRGYVYMIEYHLVWCTKYRRRVLTRAVETDCYRILREIASEYGFQIAELNGEADHVHLLVECSPQHTIPEMVKVLKGISARKLFLLHPEIKSKLWGGHLWNPSYFISTVSENTEEQIRAYIQSQKIK